MTEPEEEYQREREWYKTDVGKAFIRYTNSLVSETISGEQDRFSDKRMRELHEKTEQLRKEFLLLIRGW